MDIVSTYSVFRCCENCLYSAKLNTKTVERVPGISKKGMLVEGRSGEAEKFNERHCVCLKNYKTHNSKEENDCMNFTVNPNL